MNLIDAVDVTRRFGVTLAVDQISVTLQPGEIVGLLGANGAGKTTLMRMLLGLLEPSSGRILTMGIPAGHAKKEVGYVPQGLGLYRDLTVAENLDFVAAAFGVEPLRLTSSLSEVADRRVSEIPLGLKRRTAFAAALCHDPSLLILDEPTSGVGPLGRAELWNTIHESADGGAGVLISTHYMEETEECDRVIVMSQGHQVVAGPVADIVGSRRSVTVNGVEPAMIDQLRAAGMTVLADQAGWRVVNGDLARVKTIVGDGADVQSVPATFEEAFVAMSK